MTNILTVLPDFDVAPYSHILPSLEKALISAADLLTLDALDVAKRAQVPPGEVKKLADTLVAALHQSAAAASNASREGADDTWSGLDSGKDLADRWATISTLDDMLDASLNGGIALAHLTEIVGESAAGKTQFLLTLLLSAQLPITTGGGKPQSRSVLYISTEAPLQTTRLNQILQSHPKLLELDAKERPSLSKVHSTHIHDVEAQEHILRYQVPVAIEKHNVGLLVVDSIAANYRAEFDKGVKAKSAETLAERSNQLAHIGALLRGLARTHNIAVVVANQVADRFTTIEPAPGIHSQSTQQSRPGTPSRSTNLPQNTAAADSTPSVLSIDDPLSLDHQQRFFTGWGDDPTSTNMKTPSLGLTWTNQLSARIALLKRPIYADRAYRPGEDRDVAGWHRACKVVFSAWCGEGKTDFEIWQGGIRDVQTSKELKE
ncbi:DNA repair protein rhp57 [Fulvia fulva]|nr:DNA repair protein rhp57 [Fulvia fulva]WPV26612.1 DNA repair protein rhp57 [Fulvia fulva]